jgi:CubicO group peptidase (beta-lactamase class C family)
MQLVEQHKLSLDAPIQRYLPSFRPKNPFGGEITIRELASHRSGLAHDPPIGGTFASDSTPTLAATVASLNATTLTYGPGTRSKYSNAGVAVLGLVLERTQKEPFAAYVERAVLKPIGMDRSSFLPHPDASAAKGTIWTIDGRRFASPNQQLGVAPASDLSTSVLDLGKFIEVLSARGAVSGTSRLLSRASLDAMWTPQFASSGAETGFGIGFEIRSID